MQTNFFIKNARAAVCLAGLLLVPGVAAADEGALGMVGDSGVVEIAVEPVEVAADAGSVSPEVDSATTMSESTPCGTGEEPAAVDADATVAVPTPDVVEEPATSDVAVDGSEAEAEPSDEAVPPADDADAGSLQGDDVGADTSLEGGEPDAGVTAGLDTGASASDGTAEDASPENPTGEGEWVGADTDGSGAVPADDAADSGVSSGAGQEGSGDVEAPSGDEEGGSFDDTSAAGEDAGLDASAEPGGADAEDGGAGNVDLVGDGEAEGEADGEAEGEEGGSPVLLVSPVPTTGEPNTWLLGSDGSWYWYGADGALAQKGWLVTDVSLTGSTALGLQRYWLGDGGALVVSSLVDDAAAGWAAYATPDGYVVRGKWTDPSTGYVYLADNDGALEQAGWLVTSAYSSDGQLQRYWVDAEERACVPGLSSEGWDHYTTSEGYVVRGSWTDSSTGYVYLADNDGALEQAGWLVTSAYSSDGQLQRYWVDADSRACEPGYSEDGWAHYTTAAGYVLRGAFETGGKKYYADNDGLLASGWVVTGDFTDGQLQRYWFVGGVAASSRLVGPSEGDDSGYYAWASSDGTVLRGVWDNGAGRVYLADNDGRLLGGLTGGWVVTSQFSSDGQLQRYYIDPDDHAARSGLFEVTEEESPELNGTFWGQADAGCVLRNGCILIDGGWYQADNEGLLVYLVTGKVGYQNPSQYYQLSAYSVVSSSPDAGIFSYVSPSLISPDSTRSACVEAFISRAYDYLGTTYIWDYACAPGVGVDCAGLVLQCLYAVGMDLDYNYTPYDHYYTEGHDQYANAMRNDSKFMTVSLDERQRGDLICYEGHIAIYLGGDAVINAYPPNVHVGSIWDYGEVLAVKRVFV